MNVSAGMAEQVDNEVLDIIKKAHEKAAALLSENIEKLHELSRFLLVEETITGEEFMKIVEE
jgi:cell division protease FtsH